MVTTRLRVSGMGCEGCADIVSNALSEVPGAGDVDVDFEAGTAVVEGDTDADELLGKVDRAGYEAEVVEREPMGETEE
ncbi:heavy metal transporter [Halarchaeum grantii]|uniref:Heavy metal transporter n=1 Tax=Halarchaeum grantii TaxID=1193105 RepID=A0A830FBK9_9EURY|nr:heavy metal-associated domain-containing protein [Halarchaeum grantii]GGL30449.1 heavy metal transporter [Halarchaeum grantii]